MRSISKTWLITPIAVILLFVFWMFQGTFFSSSKEEKTSKEEYNFFFMNYYAEDEGVVFDVLEEQEYEFAVFSLDEVMDRAHLYLEEKGANPEDFSLLIDQGIYTNFSLGLNRILAWRVMFIDEASDKEQNDELLEGEQLSDTDNSILTAEESSEPSTNQEDGDVLHEDVEGSQEEVEKKLRYWIVLDAENGNLLSAYSTGK